MGYPQLYNHNLQHDKRGWKRLKSDKKASMCRISWLG